MEHQPDKPTTTPTPEDPRQKTPMQDPPVHPEHDDGLDRTKVAGSPGKEPPGDQETVRGYQSNDDESSDLEANGARGAIRPDDPSPDRVVFDENRTER
jgi:hypothetical protein